MCKSNIKFEADDTFFQCTAPEGHAGKHRCLVDAADEKNELVKAFLTWENKDEVLVDSGSEDIPF